MMTRRAVFKVLTALGMSTTVGVPVLACQAQTPPAQAVQPSPQAAAATLSRFLDGAEIQAENQAQRDQLARALRDMTTDSPAVLRQKRYTDYAGTAGKWTLHELLTRHVVPKENVHLTADTLYAALATAEGKSAVRRTLNTYEQRLKKAQEK